MATHQADIMQLVRDILAQQINDPRQARVLEAGCGVCT